MNVLLNPSYNYNIVFVDRAADMSTAQTTARHLVALHSALYLERKIHTLGDLQLQETAA